MHESLSELEAELCRLPGVIVTRFVGGSGGRPLGATIFVAAGTTDARIRASVQTIASVHFDIDLDPSRMVLIEVGETSIILPESSSPRLPTAETSAAVASPDVGAAQSVSEPVGAETPAVTTPIDAAPDSGEALASAQNAVHSLLRSLAPPSPSQDDLATSSPTTSADADTIVVGNSDTAETRPANN